MRAKCRKSHSELAPAGRKTIATGVSPWSAGSTRKSPAGAKETTEAHHRCFIMASQRDPAPSPPGRGLGNEEAYFLDLRLRFAFGGSSINSSRS